MIRLLLSWLDRRIDARITAREAEKVARAAEAIARPHEDAKRRERVVRIDEIKAAGGRPGVMIERPGVIVDLGPRDQSIASKASLKTRSVNPSAHDDISLVSSRSVKSLSSEDRR